MNKTKQQIIDLVNRYKDRMNSHNLPMNAADFSRIEKKYGLVLPESYKWFSSEFLFGGKIIDILGNYFNYDTDRIECDIDEYMELYKQHGLPDGLLILSHVDEYGYFLDTVKTEDDDCPVVSWSFYDNDGVIERNKKFYEFLLDEIRNAVDNNFFED